jgi:ABC-type Fe3+ transport system substrate-binding protein
LLLVGLLTTAWVHAVAAQAEPNWQQRWEKVLSGAKTEGKVVVFGPPGDLVRKAMTEGFKRAFPGIDIEYSGGTGGEQASKIRAERDGGIYSVDAVLSGTTTYNVLLKPMGALDPITPALILPEVADVKYWRDNTLDFSDKEGKYNIVFGAQLTHMLIYNLSEVKAQEIDELHKLLDPKWKGRIVINEPLSPGPGNLTFRWIWDVLGAEKATDFYKKIRAQAGTVDRDQRRQIEWVVQGKYAMILGPNSAVAEQLLQRGLKFGVSPEFKDYGAAVSAGFNSAMLVNKAPHPNAATVFLNWVLGREGQTAWSKAMNILSRRVDVPTAHLPSYIIPKPGGGYWSRNYKPGDRYWISYGEQNVRRSKEEEETLKEVFGR